VAKKPAVSKAESGKRRAETGAPVLAKLQSSDSKLFPDRNLPDLSPQRFELSSAELFVRPEAEQNEHKRMEQIYLSLRALSRSCHFAVVGSFV
jgi:hypothetical protein